jgi:hypothetical protein
LTYSLSPEIYDLLYAWKDYSAEADRIHALVSQRAPGARTLLDVACGTGGHLAHLRDRFSVEGLDLDPALIEHARRRLPDTAFHAGDMRTFELGRRFDVVTCLFSSIGYMHTAAELSTAIERMAGHFQTLLEGIVADPDQAISTLLILTEAERHQILVIADGIAQVLASSRRVQVVPHSIRLAILAPDCVEKTVHPLAGIIRTGSPHELHVRPVLLSAAPQDLSSADSQCLATGEIVGSDIELTSVGESFGIHIRIDRNHSYALLA